MKYIDFLKPDKVWQYISWRGVTAQNAKTQDITVLINRASFLTAISTIFYAFCAWLFFDDKVYALLSFSIGCMYFLAVVFHHFKLFAWVRFYFSIIVPLWIYLVHLTIGGQFSQSAAVITSLILIYIFYEKEPKKLWLYIGINVTLFVFTIIYVEIFGTLLPSDERPYDEIGVFVVSLIWTYMILQKHDHDKSSLIKNLEEKNAKLKTTTEELERFTNIASHDLKSPLRNIVSFLGLMERDLKRGNLEDLASYLSFAKSGALQMNYHIQGILEISRVESNVNAERNWVDLNHIMEQVKVNLSQELAEAKAILDCGNLPNCYCNDVEFTLLFQNLIQNGLKYNKSPRPELKIWAEALPNKTFDIHFSDNGIGIEPKYHDYIFEHFKRLHSSQVYMGTGLGLSICKKIVEKHGGSISLKSNEGEGSIFTLRLPNRVPSAE